MFGSTLWANHGRLLDWKKEAKGPARKALTETLGGVRAVLTELAKPLRGHLLGDLAMVVAAVTGREPRRFVEVLLLLADFNFLPF
jgi:hypothetical protein